MELGEWGDGEDLLETGRGETLKRLYCIKIFSIKRDNMKINRRKHLTTHESGSGNLNFPFFQEEADYAKKG